MSELLGIFGAGRNGSTLLARLLDGSPDLWLHPVDVVFLPLWDDLAGRGAVSGASYRTATTRPLRHLDRSLSWRAAAQLYELQWAELEQEYAARLAVPLELRRDALAALDRPGETTIDEFVPAFLDAARRFAARSLEPDPRYLCFKTSETAYIDDYLRLWPELRCVHIVRDPIDNYRSAKRTWMETKRKPFWTHGEDVLRVFLEARWLPHARAIVRLRDQDPERHQLVRYEDLLADAEGEVRGLCARLGVRPPADPALQTGFGGERFASVPPNTSAGRVETPSAVVTDMAARVGYKEVLTEREMELIARVTSPLAAELGYRDLPAAPSSFALWLRWLPIDRSERSNVRNPVRLLVEVAKRRAYLTRTLLSS